MISPLRYLDAIRVTAHGQGGQELILPEILGLLESQEIVWLPFPEQCVTLTLRLGVRWRASYEDCSVLYFGTPTIVNDKPLFNIPAGGKSAQVTWTKSAERSVVRSLCYLAEQAGFRLIISGLGSGDISVEERLEDMEGGEVVTMKKFDGFTDWVLCRKLHGKTSNN